MSQDFKSQIKSQIKAGLVKEAAEECLESAYIAFSESPDFLREMIYVLATEIAQGMPTRPRPAKGGRFAGQRRVAITVHDDETDAEFPIVRHVSQTEFERIVCADAKARIDSGTRVGEALTQTGNMFNIDAQTVKKYRRNMKQGTQVVPLRNSTPTPG